MNVRKSGLIALCGMAIIASTAWAQAPAAKPGDATKPAPTQPAKPSIAPPVKPDAAKPQMDPDTEAMIKAGTPGQHHKYFEPLVGEWETTVRMFMPGQPTPMESKMTCSSKLEFDGRYLYSHWSGEFGGMPFKGVSVMGYDNVAKQYESTWIDNMSTAIAYSSGTCDASGKVFTLSGESSEASATGGGRVKGRKVMTVTDNDHNKMEFFKTGADGKESKVMEMECVRKTGATKATNKPAVKIESKQPGDAKKPAPAPDKK